MSYTRRPTPLVVDIMRFAIASGSIASLLAVVSLRLPAPAATERVTVNDNRAAAGTLHDGVLTIRLEAREADWHPDRDSDPGIVIHAFAEEGKQPLVPGPLIRVSEGTEIHAFVRNTLSRTLTMNGLSTRGIARTDTTDTMQVSPGAVREVHFVAGAPGTYYYRGTVDGITFGSPTPDAELNGAFVIDPRGTSTRSRDRIFVIGFWEKRARNIVLARTDVMRFTINGKAWPNTERLAYDLGDTVRFRIVNPSTAPHPMHLHGFYFNVNSRGGAAKDTIYARGSSPYRVVTERAAPGRTFTMTWVPERAGNWLFHCHDNYHVLRNAPLDDTPLPEEQMLHAENHAMEMMGGLVMGIEVRAGAGAEIVAQGAPRRTLRLVVRVDANGGGTASEPSYQYVLHEGSQSSSTNAQAPGPTILLKRGQPVSITVVNELAEPTAVHWHGIELESYFDGVAGFAGQGKRIAPVIAARDSFEARFTPPRSGTFIYHPHADEVRQQKAGLSGALLVVDSPAAFNPANDMVFLLTVPRLEADRNEVLINGSKTPPALEMRVGERYRLRIVDIHTFRPSMIVRVLRDSTPVAWRAIAKDGMDIPGDRATTRPAVQQMGNGETYDFELAPVTPGDLRFTVSSGVGALLASIPIRVR
jgi:FtsP/CotA-like multicopper oxidase with cupredoxin domain